ncbi:molybdopterin-dependent oxidoreductase [Desulfitobacterium sp. AusDCA]|uniref:molybdopterin-dependent oxidoreductase n=1 Tax=Desulfitobacterium sp. AusDCA TaxID=3240383 RepID=UPI003DA71D35
MAINKDLYRLDKHWKEGEFDVYRNIQWTGPGCHDGCGALFYVKDGKLDHIEGDPNDAFNRGRLCMRCLNMVDEAVNNPTRLSQPLKRAGKRGENKWEKITWDQAYDIIEENVRKIWKENGPESIIALEGTGRDVIWQVPLLEYAAFKSPNFGCGFLSGDSCYLPRCIAAVATYGGVPVVDCGQYDDRRYDSPNYRYPEVILVWGCNAIVSNADGFLGHWIVDCMKDGGTKLIVVDPRLTWLASRADVWLQVRPGTDNAVAMAMLNTIIKEDLYDHEFVEKWTYGFDELTEAITEYTPEKAAEIAWLDKNDIIKAARLFAKGKRSAFHWGLATDMTPNGVCQAQSFMALIAICGNLDAPGGNYLATGPYGVNTMYSVGFYEFLDEEMRAKQIGTEKYPLHKYGPTPCAVGDEILKQIEDGGDPYPIKMMYLAGTNPIANMGADAARVYKAMMQVPFTVVADLWMTPTAVACADLVLPVTMSCERNSVREWWSPVRAITKMTEYGECKSDEQICVDLGRRLNPENFPWKTDVELCDWLLKKDNAPLGFEELAEKVAVYDFKGYYRYKDGKLRPDGEPGFNTASGLIELYSTMLDGLGNRPVTYYEEPPESPVSTPDLYKEYPLVLTTGKRSWEFFHSEHRNMPTMREFHPNPLVDIHPDDAEQLGIENGDWVWIENQRGRCRQVANVTVTTKKGVVNAEHGWSFPEQEAAAPHLMGVFDSNINNLTSQCVVGETGYGAPYKCLLCKIYKCTEENSKVLPGEAIAVKGVSK